MQNSTSVRLSDKAMELRAELAERCGISLNSITEMAIRSLASQDDDYVTALRILCAPESLHEAAAFLLGPRYDFNDPIYMRLEHMWRKLRETGRLPEASEHFLIGFKPRRNPNLAIKT